MMRPRASLFALLLACIPAAWADTINVTTVVDEDNVAYPNSANTGCSLREAVKYMELSTAARTAGYGGCVIDGAVSSSDSIVVPVASSLNSAVSVYQLTLGQIPVTVSFTINGTPSASVTANDAVVATVSNASTNPNLYPVIQAASGSRIFSINYVPGQSGTSSPTVPSPASSTATGGNLTLTELQLIGCGSNCAVNGGIVDVEDALTVTQVVFSNGSASNSGGAIYIGPTGSLAVTGADFERNTASHGAAIAVGYNNLNSVNGLSVTQALFSQNTATATNSSGAVVGAVVELLPSTVGSGSSFTSSTISGNTGVGLRAATGLVINNVTIVNNTAGGIDWQNIDLGVEVSLYNSIVAGNPVAATTPGAALDCINANAAPSPAVISTFSYNVFGPGSGCTPLLLASSSNQSISNTGNQQVIAADCSSTGTPLPITQPGLLCPLPAAGASVVTMTRWHRPRLMVQPSTPAFLADPASWLGSDESLNVLINKGSPSSSAEVCASADQRGDSQRPNSCDIGAVALQSVDVTISLQTPLSTPVSGSFLSSMADLDLLPAFACSQVGLSSVATTEAGCFKVLSAPTKGSFYVDPMTDNVVYTPSSGYYGLDTFSFLVATTLSRFSDINSDPVAGQYTEVTVSVQTNPVVTSHSSGVSAGAWTGLDLLALCSLFVFRARRPPVSA